MKNKPWVIAALLSAFTFGSVAAQEGMKPRRNTEEQVQKRMEKLREDLDLTDAQYAKLKALNAEKRAAFEKRKTNRPEITQKRRDYAQKLKEELKLTDAQVGQIKALRQRQAAEMKALRIEMKEKHAAFENELKGILDENQWKQWEEKKQDFRRPQAEGKKHRGK